MSLIKMSRMDRQSDLLELLCAANSHVASAQVPPTPVSAARRPLFGKSAESRNEHQAADAEKQSRRLRSLRYCCDRRRRYSGRVQRAIRRERNKPSSGGAGTPVFDTGLGRIGPIPLATVSPRQIVAPGSPVPERVRLFATGSRGSPLSRSFPWRARMWQPSWYRFARLFP